MFICSWKAHPIPKLILSMRNTFGSNFYLFSFMFWNILMWVYPGICSGNPWREEKNKRLSPELSLLLLILIKNSQFINLNLKWQLLDFKRSNFILCSNLRLKLILSPPCSQNSCKIIIAES